MIDANDALFRYHPHLRTRWASPENIRGESGAACRGNDGRKRAAYFAIAAGESRILAEEKGVSGCIRRIWMTMNERVPAMLRGLRLDIYWDGAVTPAVSAPLGDFFCHPLGRMAVFQNACFSSPEGRSFNCVIPMPFRTGMRVVVTNETGDELPMFFYDVDYTLGDIHGDDVLYFHAHWRRESMTTICNDFQLLPQVQGHGRLLGVHVGVIADSERYFKSWWGEGEVKVYLDGDTAQPTLCGTGTEDYIGTGWGQGEYAQWYQGCHLADHEAFRYGFYRLHIPDPMLFHQNIRVTIQQIGCWDPESIVLMQNAGVGLMLGEMPIDMVQAATVGGYGIFERQDDWCSCAYFYLHTAENGLPELAPLPARLAGL